MSNAHRIVLNTLGKLRAHRHGLFGFLSAPQLASLAENGPDADRLRRAISESMGKDCFDSQERAD
jgi:hypothetical protein